MEREAVFKLPAVNGNEDWVSLALSASKGTAGLRNF